VLKHSLCFAQAKGFALQTHIGCTKGERDVLQTLRCSVQVYFDAHMAFSSGELKDTVDYVSLVQISQNVAQSKSRNLLESLCFDIAQNLFLDLMPIQKVSIYIEKFSTADFPNTFAFGADFQRP